MDNILVTGGAGFLGSYLIEELLKKNKNVTVFDNGFRNSFVNIEKLRTKKLTIIKGDVTKKEDWNQIPKDIDFAFHFAAINGTKYFYEIPEKVIKVNVTGSMNFFNWISISNIKRFFFASSSEVYGFPIVFPTSEIEPLVVPDPKNPRFSYSASKIIGEIATINFAKTYGFDYTIGRFHNIYGPRMGFEHVIPEFIRKCVQNEKFVVQGDGTESRSFCFISDAIKATLLICEKEEGRNEIFNIGNSEEVTIKNLIKMLEQIHGKKITPIFTPLENSGTKRRFPDLTKIKNLGYEPQTSLEIGLKQTYDWYSSYYKNLQ